MSRRTRAEMPAYAEEIEAAHREGVALLELALPVRLVWRDDTGSEARLAGVECIRTRLGYADATGRGAPVPVLGSEFVLPADSIIDALGEETSPDALTRDPVLREALTRIDPWGAAARNGIFAGGDFAGTRRTVAHAIGSGKRAALAIDRFLRALEWSSLETFRIGRGPVSLEAYRSGGPYLAFAKQAGSVPPTTTKQTHSAERDQFKACVLAVQYGMGEGRHYYLCPSPKILRYYRGFNR